MSPTNRSDYPANWEEISSAIRFGRAMSRCECYGECGTDHSKEATYVTEIGTVRPDPRCWAIHGFEHPVTFSTVVLTTAHLDHDTSNNSPENLRAFCQRCHNAYDSDYRTLNRARNKIAAEIAAGQIEMFPSSEEE